jgi:flavin-dependent dehydrogenase
LLQKAAVEAGAELMDRTRVTSLVRMKDRVAGVRVVTARGDRLFSAGLVVGADGRHSTIARLVEAGEYFGYDGARAGFWGYWNAPSFWKTDPAYGFDVYFSHCDDETGVIFPTDHDQLLIGSWPSVDRADHWRADPEGTLLAVLASEPAIGPLIREGRPVGKVVGTVRERFFFRTGAGNGWALVGDAGHHKDFVIGDGITEALLQARSLATAIGANTDSALTRWWRARDVEALPWYFVGKEAGAAGPLPELHRLFISGVAAQPELKARIVEMIERRRSPVEMVSGSAILGRTLAAAVLGRPRVIGDLWAASQRTASMLREWRTLRRLLSEAERQAARDERLAA